MQSSFSSVTSSSRRGAFGRTAQSAWFPSPMPILNGDDAAALPDGDGRVLFAAEGMRSEFLAADPWFGGFCSVMVNLNDIAAMGGRPWAIDGRVVHAAAARNERVLEGIVLRERSVRCADRRWPHVTRAGASFLAVSVRGKADALISGHHAQAGQSLLVAVEFARHASRVGHQLQRGQRRFARPAAPAIGAVARGRRELDWSAWAWTSAWRGCVVRCDDARNIGGRRNVDLVRLPAPRVPTRLRWLNAFPSFWLRTRAPSLTPRARWRSLRGSGRPARQRGEVDRHPRLELSYGRTSELLGTERTADGFWPAQCACSHGLRRDDPPWIDLGISTYSTKPSAAAPSMLARLAESLQRKART